MLENILMIAGGVLAGVVVGLKVIAPMTSTTKDDEVLKKLEALEALVKKLTA